MSDLGPFQTGTYRGEPIGSVTIEDRLRAVKGFTAAQCQQALALDGLQKTVRNALEKRLRALSKGAKGVNRSGTG